MLSSQREDVFIYWRKSQWTKYHKISITAGHVSSSVPNIPIPDNDARKLSLIETFHENSMIGGHCGPARVLAKLRRQFRWKGMKRQVFEFCSKCPKCQLNKGQTLAKEPLALTNTPERAFEMIVVDTVGPLITCNSFRYILTIQCRLTKFIILSPLKTKSAEEIAQAIFDNSNHLHGFPKTILTDNGSEYKNEIVHEILKICQVEHKFSTSYHPQTIGDLERNHRVLNEYLRNYINIDHIDKFAERFLKSKFITRCHHQYRNINYNIWQNILHRASC